MQEVSHAPEAIQAAKQDTREQKSTPRPKTSGKEKLFALLKKMKFFKKGTKEQSKQLEQPQNPETEQVRQAVKDTMTSRFGLIPEAVDVSDHLETTPELTHAGGFDTLTKNLSRLIRTRMLDGEGKVLVVQRFPTSAAIATSPLYLLHGLDMYYAFPQPNEALYQQGMPQSTYHQNIGDNEMQEALLYGQGIQQAKSQLTEEGLRGLVLNIDRRARAEDEHGDFDNLFPTPEKLRELGITRVAYVAEFSPQNEAYATRNISHGTNLPTHSEKYLHMLSQQGFPVAVYGAGEPASAPQSSSIRNEQFYRLRQIKETGKIDEEIYGIHRLKTPLPTKKA